MNEEQISAGQGLIKDFWDLYHRPSLGQVYHAVVDEPFPTRYDRINKYMTLAFTMWWTRDPDEKLPEYRDRMIHEYFNRLIGEVIQLDDDVFLNNLLRIAVLKFGLRDAQLPLNHRAMSNFSTLYTSYGNHILDDGRAGALKVGDTHYDDLVVQAINTFVLRDESLGAVMLAGYAGLPGERIIG